MLFLLVCECWCVGRAQIVSRCEQLTDEGIHALTGSVAAAETLTELGLDNLPLITDASLTHLQSCSVLRRADLFDCQNLSRTAIRRLKARARARSQSHPPCDPPPRSLRSQCITTNTFTVHSVPLPSRPLNARYRIYIYYTSRLLSHERLNFSESCSKSTNHSIILCICFASTAISCLYVGLLSEWVYCELFLKSPHFFL